MQRRILRQNGITLLTKARNSSNYIATKPLIQTTYVLTLNLCG